MSMCSYACMTTFSAVSTRPVCPRARFQTVSINQDHASSDSSWMYLEVALNLTSLEAMRPQGPEQNARRYSDMLII